MADAPHHERHRLPPRFGDTLDVAAASPARPRRTAAWALSLVAFLLLLGLGAQLTAHLRYDHAAESFAAAARQSAEARSALTQELTRASLPLHDALALRDADSGLLTTPASAGRLDEVIAQAEGVFTEAQEAASTPPSALPEKPFLLWELIPAADRLAEEAQAEKLRAEALPGHTENVADALEGIRKAVGVVAEEAVAAAEEVEAQHVAARNQTIIDLRFARAALSERTAHGAQAPAEQFAALDTAAAEVVASHEEVRAALTGPLREKQLAIEEYARSIAGGVLLDVEWPSDFTSPNRDFRSGGYVTYFLAYGGYATMTLSPEVAREWPSAVMKALVAHEVGHVISAKCYEMFDWEDADANEEWATAWAISLGHTDPNGNGAWYYGQPRREIIEAAKTCR